ncbi:MAG TPA: hypothetical protein VHG28_13595 [Longimicrobiaceae bacterium]|nr:hypothetical protein [Longimicrobiaceae bacterium]
MSPATADRLRLVDAPDESRTTTTLVASLAGRLGVLPLVSGAMAVGSLVSGFAALGRQVGRTVEGAQLRRALEAGRPGVNGPVLWRALRLDELAASAAPSPVLDQLRNDLALLLAGDLDETLALMPIPPQPAGASVPDAGPRPEFLDCMLGMWAFGRELAWAVEALAAPTLDPAGAVETGAPPAREAPGPVLR